MITDTNAVGIADRLTWAASHRLRDFGAARLVPSFLAEGEKSVLRMVAQIQGGVPPRREPH